MDTKKTAVENKKILIIDNDVLFSRVFKKFLEEKRGFFEITLSHDAEESLRVATEDPPDLIIVDINTTQMSGIELYKRLSALEKNERRVPVLIFTKRKELEDIFYDMGAESFIIKSAPFDPDYLLQEIDRIVQRRHKPLIFLIDVPSKPHTKNLRIELRRLGFRVMVIEGIGMFMTTSIRVRPDMIVMEYEQQDILTGKDFIKKLREIPTILSKDLWPPELSLPIVVYSFSNQDYKRFCLEAGADAFVGKPLNLDPLLGAVHQLYIKKMAAEKEILEKMHMEEEMKMMQKEAQEDDKPKGDALSFFK